jgi:serine protease Do
LPGDVILKFNGTEIKDSKLLPRIVADSPIGKEVDVVVLRKGEELTKKVKLGRLENFDKKQAGENAEETEEVKSSEMLGMTIDTIDEGISKKFNLKENQEGVIISDVDPNSSAAEKGIRPGDVIIEVGQEAVKSPSDVEKRIDGLKKEGKKNALLLISGNGGQLRFVVLRIDE